MNGRAIAVLAGAVVGLLGLAAASEPDEPEPEATQDPPPTDRQELEREFQRIRTELREALADVRGEIRDDVEEALTEHTRPTAEGLEALNEKFAHIGHAQAATEAGDEDEPDEQDDPDAEGETEDEDDSTDPEPEASGEDA